MKVYYETDADLSLIKGRKVTIVGYGSQGHAHAQHLDDSGVKVMGRVRTGGAAGATAPASGLQATRGGPSGEGRPGRPGARTWAERCFH